MSRRERELYELALGMLLAELKRNGGAILSWQIRPEARPLLAPAIAAGELVHDEHADLIVHPEAVRIGEGAYTMPADDRSGELFGKG